MKPVLLALALIAACVVYEIDRDARLRSEWRSMVIMDRVMGDTPAQRGVWTPRHHVPDHGAAAPAPHEADAHGMATGRVEREKSIRLFGPGVSRRQQIRV